MSLSSDPGWGSAHRDRKAAAILHTLIQWRGDGVKSARWLDAGCGSGGIAAGLATSVASVVAADPQPWSGWPLLMQRHANLRFVTGPCDGADPPVPDGSVDVAVCNQVYEHVHDPQRLIGNIARCLAPGGVCYFAGPNLLFPVEPHVFWPFVHWLPRAFAQRTMALLGARHPEYLDAYSTHYWRLRRWFREAGLTVSNGLRERTAAGLELRGSCRSARAVRAAPAWLFDVFAPLSPGFVFRLEKPA